ncbi:MAG: sel1 repeat family protein [Thermoguttaceae bacterium]|nr:sel1 repeat family protein [Thermoguttaceae bacterium]
MHIRLIQIIVILLISSVVFAEGTSDSTISAIRNAAEQGDPDAQYLLGRSYYYGKGTVQDKQLGIYWLQKSAEQNHALAQFKLAHFYFRDRSKVDKSEALDLLKKAAEQNLPEAQYYLYTVYSNDYYFITTKDIPEAIKWLRKAAENDYVEAQLQLANHYYKGIGVSKNEAEARKWSIRAVNNYSKRSK